MSPICPALGRSGYWAGSCTWTNRRSTVLFPLLRLRRISLLAAVVLLPGLSPSGALAQDVTPLKVGDYGPYYVSVVSNPERPVEGLGGPRFTVQVYQASDKVPVIDATVVVSFKSPDGVTVGQVTLPQNPSFRQYYEGRVTLEQVGEWNWTVAIDSPRGLATITGTIEILEAPAPVGRSNFGFIGMILGLGAIAVLAYFALRQKKGERRNPEEMFRERMARSRVDIERELREREARRNKEKK